MAARNALVLINGEVRELPTGDSLNGATGGGGGIFVANSYSLVDGELIITSSTNVPILATGTTTANFGTGSGTNHITTTITGQTGLLSTSTIKAWIAPVATATHNELEHLIVPFKIGITNIVAGTGFTINVFSDYRLTGTFTVQWEWY